MCNSCTHEQRYRRTAMSRHLSAIHLAIISLLCMSSASRLQTSLHPLSAMALSPCRRCLTWSAPPPAQIAFRKRLESLGFDMVAWRRWFERRHARDAAEGFELLDLDDGAMWDLCKWVSPWGTALSAQDRV